MKVTVVAGLARSLLNFRKELLCSMTRLGYEVVAMAPDIRPETAEGLRLIGVKPREISLSRASVNPLLDVICYRSLRAAFEEERPDVVLNYTVKPVVYGSLAAASLGIRNVYSLITGLGYAFTGGTLRQRAVGTLARMLYRRALLRNERVLFQNPDDRELFRKEGLLRSNDQAVVVNGSGINLAEFPASPLPEGSVNFLFVGRLLADKGVREFVEAARRVKSRHPKARFRIVGSSDPNPSAVKPDEIEGWRREGVVELAGWVADIKPEILGASVFVLPSYREGTPRSSLEALSMGRPIITTDAPGCRETVRPGVNGFLIPVKDSAALADAMSRFIASPGLIPLMARASRTLAEEKYDVHRVNAVMLGTMGLC